MIKVLIINITVVAFVLVSCNTYKNNITYKYRIQNNEINYHDFGNWAAHPLKKDNSDSVSNIFSENVNIDLADIFFCIQQVLQMKDSGMKKMAHWKMRN